MPLPLTSEVDCIDNLEDLVYRSKFTFMMHALHYDLYSTVLIYGSPITTYSIVNGKSMHLGRADCHSQSSRKPERRFLLLCFAVRVLISLFTDFFHVESLWEFSNKTIMIAERIVSN